MAPPKKLPSGRWQVRIKDPLTGKWRAKNFRTQTDAKRFQDETTADVLTGRYVNPAAGKITLQRFYDEWADLQVWEDTTRRQYDHSVKFSKLGQVDLSRITETHGAAWVKQMIKTGLAPQTITQRVTNLKVVLNAAIKQKRISENVFTGLTLPKIRDAEHSMIIPTQDDVLRARAAAPADLELMICLAAYTGLRMAEVCGLQVRDIDFLRRQLHVARQSKGNKVRPPKHGSERVVQAPDELLEMLSRRVALLSGEEPGWLFPGRYAGRPVTESNTGNRWRALRITKAVNLPHIPFHAFRHFYASGLIAARCDVVEVQEAMGHTKSSITLNTYSHLFDRTQDRTRTAAAALMKPSTAATSDSDRTAKIIQLRDQGF